MWNIESAGNKTVKGSWMLFFPLLTASLLISGSSAFVKQPIPATMNLPHTRNFFGLDPQREISFKLYSHQRKSQFIRDNILDHFFEQRSGQPRLNLGSYAPKKLDHYCADRLPKIKKFLSGLDYRDSPADVLASILLELWIWDALVDEVSQKIFAAIKEHPEGVRFPERKIYRLIRDISNFRAKRDRSAIWNEFEHLIFHQLQMKCNGNTDYEKYQNFLNHKKITGEIMSFYSSDIKFAVKKYIDENLLNDFEPVLAGFEFHSHLKTPNWKDTLETSVRMTFMYLQLGTLEFRNSVQFVNIHSKYSEKILQHISESQLKSIFRNVRLTKHSDDGLLKVQKELIMGHFESN